MKYIPLDEVKEILNCFSKWPLSMQNHLDMFDKFNSIKSIDLSIIDEMIEKNKKNSDYMNEKLVWPARENILLELKERLSLNK